MQSKKMPILAWYIRIMGQTSKQWETVNLPQLGEGTKAYNTRILKSNDFISPDTSKLLYE